MKPLRILINLVMVGLAIGLGVALSLKPWQKYEAQQKATEEQERITKEAERARARDMLLDAKYGTTAGREELARKQGFRKPNEVPVSP